MSNLMAAFLDATTKPKPTPQSFAAQAFSCRDVTSDAIKSALEEWFSLYLQRTPTETEDPCQRLPYTIVHKLSKTVFAEYASSVTNATSSRKAAFVNSTRRALDDTKKSAMQWALVGGSVLLKPIAVSSGFVFLPIRRDGYAVFGRAPDGRLTDVGCCEFSTVGKYFYTLAERRTQTPQGVSLTYRLFESDTRDALGKRVPLARLDSYSALQESALLPSVPGVGLVEMRLPMVNCVDGSADSVSVLEPAVGLIHNINRTERQLSAEFENGRSRVFASSDVMATDTDGKRSLKDDVFVTLDDAPENIGVTVYSPQLRDESYTRRRQGYLKAIENAIGLKRGMLSDVEAAERTATEVNSSAGDYSLTTIDLQNMWHDAMCEAVALCNTLGRLYGLCDATAFDMDNLTMCWGNGVLYDKRQEWLDDLQMVQSKMLKAEIALARKYDLPWDTPEALAAIRETYMPDLQVMLEG